MAGTPSGNGLNAPSDGSTWNVSTCKSIATFDLFPLQLPCCYGGFGSRLCENSAEVASPKNVDKFSRPQADQKEENRKRTGCEGPFSTEFKLGMEFSHMG